MLLFFIFFFLNTFNVVGFKEISTELSFCMYTNKFDHFFSYFLLFLKSQPLYFGLFSKK